MASRNALLKHLRINVQAPNPRNPTPFVVSSNLLGRCFSNEVRCPFLDRSQVTHRVVDLLKHFMYTDSHKVTPNSHFQNDLGFDISENSCIVMALEEEFGFGMSSRDAAKINSVNAAVDFFASHPWAK
ncbi:hypothetical protein HHK36_022508 [Tetracentron sinense]|uniref:Carrier domain-containing protein n=1 Tax=Tetracentron sinense TaxID=13715 RepID=A0A834YV22_TETSI|nr:hypothetical protein HHK36_022508 [Tetracentron sinense]